MHILPMPIIAGITLLAISAARAQNTSATWDTDSAGNWTDVTKWLGDIAYASGVDNTATFGNSITGNRTITLDAGITIGHITASDTSHNYTISGANTLTLDVTTGVPIIDVTTSGRTLQIDSIITGSDGLRKDGAGILILNGANSYTGDTTITGGILDVDVTSKNPISSGSLFLSGGGYLRISSTNVASTNGVTVGSGGGSISVNGNNNFTTSGKLSGAGTLTFADVGGGGGRSLNFNATNNDFTGGIIVSGGNSLTFTTNSLTDSTNNIAFTATSGSNGFTYSSGAITGLTLTNRSIEMNSAGAMSTTITNNNTTHSITINSNLVATGAGNKTLILNSASTGPTNLFAGNITNGTDGGTIALKVNTNKWELSGAANTYSGDTLVNSTLTMHGTGAVSPNTRFRLGGDSGSAGNGNTIRILTNDSGTLNFGNQIDLRTVQTSAAATWGVHVANDGGTTTDTTIALGKVNFAYITDYRAAGATLNTTGANGYRVQVSDVDLNWGQRGTQRFNPTTAPITITGTVKQVNGRLSTGSSVGSVTLGTQSQTLTLDGTAIGNLVSGAIKNATDYDDLSNPNALALNLTKAGTGDWTLSGANTYTGNTTVSAGTLTLSTTGQLLFDIGANGVNNAILGSGTLVLDGSLVFDLADASTTISDFWNIVAVGTLNETYDSNFSVKSLLGSFSETAGIWTIAENGVTYEFSESTGQLTVLAAIPEPRAAILGLIGLVALLIRRKR